MPAASGHRLPNAEQNRPHRRWRTSSRCAGREQGVGRALNPQQKAASSKHRRLLRQVSSPVILPVLGRCPGRHAHSRDDQTMALGLETGNPDPERQRLQPAVLDPQGCRRREAARLEPLPVEGRGEARAPARRGSPSRWSNWPPTRRDRERYKLLLSIAARGAALRRSQGVAALRRGSVDGRRPRQGVTRVREGKGWRWHIGPPKTSAGVRDVYLPTALLPDLRVLLAALAGRPWRGVAVPGDQR